LLYFILSANFLSNPQHKSYHFPFVKVIRKYQVLILSFPQISAEPDQEPEPMTPYRPPHHTHNAYTGSRPSTSSRRKLGAEDIQVTSSTSTSRNGAGSDHRSGAGSVSDHRSGAGSVSGHRSGAGSVSDNRSGAGSESRRRASPTIMGMREYRERRQSIRGGSAESALSMTRSDHGHDSGGGRSLVGEGFRAAGLSPTKRRYGGSGSLDLDGGVRRGESGSKNGDVFMSEGTRVVRERMGNVTSTPRAATSMADYRYGRGDDYDDDDDDDRMRRLRGPRSAFPLRDGREREREMSLTRERDREREREMDRENRSVSSMSMSRYDAGRHHQPSQERYASPFGSRRYTPVAMPPPPTTSGAGAVAPPQEHTRLMMESLVMFEGHLARLGPTLSGTGGGSGSGSGANTPNGGGGGDLMRIAQTVAGAAERLNAMMRYGTTRAMEAQVEAEVEGRDLGDVWRGVGGEFREAQRVSDDLVRGLTGLLLGIGKVMREFAGGGGVEGQHLRSISLDEEGLRVAGRRARGSFSPDVGGGGSGTGSTGGGSGSGRRSVESRRSWEPSRDDIARRLAGRNEGAAPTPPQAFRDREKFEGRYETPPSAASQNSALRNSVGTRRLFTPREQQQMATSSSTRVSGVMVASDSQETIYAGHEPSPTPASRNQTTLGRSRTLPPLLPKPLPTLPSESLLRRTEKNISPGALRDREREHRQASVTSIATVRANTSHVPTSLTTPSNATTAVTPHTVSAAHTPDRATFPIPVVLSRMESEQVSGSGVAFSRPLTVSVSALNGLQQQDIEHERRRTLSSGSAGVEPSTSVPPQKWEETARRKTMGVRAGRISLDGNGGGSGTRTATGDGADGVGLGGVGKPPGVRRERRRTVTDIWPKE
jgi:hypothetical protein